VARRVLDKLVRFAHGAVSAEESSAYDLPDNPYWPKRMRTIPKHERFVLLLPLALSQTQDDKARVLWTVYGASEQGPARPFWSSFFTAPGVEVPEAEALDFFRRLLHGA